MNRSLLLSAPGTFTVTGAPVPEPGPGEALIKVAAAGICGSDRELYEGTRPRGFGSYPIVPGHEWSGVVAAAGPGVDPGLVGLPTVGEGYHNCQSCGRCYEGDTNLCVRGYDETGFTRPGAFADYLVLPARLLHTLPPGTDLRAAALLEPAAVAAAAVLRSAVRPGERAAVVGAGTLGVLTLQTISACSPAALLAIDPRPGRALPAHESGATEFRAPADTTALDGMFDVVVETAGVHDSAAAAGRLLRRGGRLVLAGIPGGGTEGLSPSLIVQRQLTVSSVFGAPSAAWAHAVRMFRAGLLRLAPLITHELPLADFAAALDLMKGGRDDVGKILLCP